MRFELDQNNLNVPDEVVLADLKRTAAQASGQRLTQRFSRQHGRFSASMIERRFGSWNKALELARLVISKRHGIDDDVLFSNLEAIWRHLGRQPRRDDLDSMTSTVSKSVYEYRWGSWRKALEAFASG